MPKNGALIKRIQYSIENEGVTVEKLYDLLSVVDGTDRKNLWYIRTKAREIQSEKGLEIMFQTYVLGGRYNFDDYMSRCEFYREPQARFWWPRRKILEGKFGIATEIQKFIDNPKAKFLSISCPPGVGKSTLIKFLLSYIAGRYPTSANMYVSYSDGIIKMMEDSIRGILTDTDEYRHNEVFENGKPDLSAEYHTISYRSKGDFPTIGLVSLGGSVTGRTRANKFLITDDLVRNAEMARSPDRLDNLWEDYRSTLTTRMIGDDVKQIMLGTIWSVHDPISRMKAEHEGDPAYKFIAIPVWDENEQSNFEYEHPDRYTTERIREIKRTIDPVQFSCLYMQRGIEKEGLAFPYNELQYWNGVLPDGEPDNIKFFCDVAFGGGDSLAMPIAYIYGDDVYIVDVVFNAGDKKVTEPLVAGKIRSWGCRSGRFERNNGGEFFKDDVEKLLRKSGYHCNITAKRANNRMSKERRIEQFAPDIKQFYFLDEKHRTEEYRRFMGEVYRFSFTGKNKHDDAPDALAGLCEYMMNGLKLISAAKRII